MSLKSKQLEVIEKYSISPWVRKREGFSQPLVQRLWALRLNSCQRACSCEHIKESLRASASASNPSSYRIFASCIESFLSAQRQATGESITAYEQHPRYEWYKPILVEFLRRIFHRVHLGEASPFVACLLRSLRTLSGALSRP